MYNGNGGNGGNGTFNIMVIAFVGMLCLLFVVMYAQHNGGMVTFLTDLLNIAAGM